MMGTVHGNTGGPIASVNPRAGGSGFSKRSNLNLIGWRGGTWQGRSIKVELTFPGGKRPKSKCFKEMEEKPKVGEDEHCLKIGAMLGRKGRTASQSPNGAPPEACIF